MFSNESPPVERCASSTINTTATSQTHLFTNNLSSMKYNYVTLNEYGDKINNTTNVKGDLKVELTCSNGNGMTSAVVSRTVGVDGAPSLSLKNSTKTETDLTITLSASSKSGISNYEFKISSSPWINNGANNVYTFGGLYDSSMNGGVYSRVTNNVGLTAKKNIVGCSTYGGCACSNGTLTGNVTLTCKDLNGKILSQSIIQKCGGSCGSSSGGSGECITFNGANLSCICKTPATNGGVTAYGTQLCKRCDGIETCDGSCHC